MTFIQHPLAINVGEIASNVMGLRRYWIKRDAEHPFYTLGRCAYLDGKTPNYKAETPETNLVLYQNFGVMYDTIEKYLTEQLGEPVTLDVTLAHPSFHIIGADPFFLTHAGIWHEDYPHKTLGLGDEDPLTFTVAIELPYGGGGLEYIENNMQMYIPYREGSIVIHDGTITHRIASFGECIMGDYRITLQGHLIRRNGRLVMFW